MEDECHFLLECPIYNELRKKYIPKYFIKNPSMYKFTELMNNDNVKTVLKVAAFLYKATVLKKVLSE